MPLVAAKCLECGGELQIDNAQDAAVCPYCGTPFVVEKAINYYNTQNVTNIGNVAHADIHVNDDTGLEARLANAEAFLTQHKDYDKAEKLFLEITESFSHDYRGWWGVVRAMTHEFTGLTYYPYIHLVAEIYEKVDPVVDAERELPRIREFADRAFNVISPEEKTRCQQIWDDYVQSFDQYRNALVGLVVYADKFHEACREQNQWRGKLKKERKYKLFPGGPQRRIEELEAEKEQLRKEHNSKIANVMFEDYTYQRVSSGFRAFDDI